MVVGKKGGSEPKAPVLVRSSYYYPLLKGKIQEQFSVFCPIFSPLTSSKVVTRPPGECNLAGTPGEESAEYRTMPPGGRHPTFRGRAGCNFADQGHSCYNAARRNIKQWEAGDGRGTKWETSGAELPTPCSCLLTPQKLGGKHGKDESAKFLRTARHEI
jgi:hypothetical protein